jgi:hypothetical protein
MIRLLLLVVAVRGFVASGADPASIPEIEGPRATYHQALAQIRAERDQKAAEATRTYAGRLQDLHKKFTDEGETQAAAAVQAEIDRLAKAVELSNEERRKMTGLLLATRVLYEKNRGPAYMAAAKSEGQAHEAWAQGLNQLAAHLARQREFPKVLVVKAELAQLELAKAEAAKAGEIAAAAMSAPATDNQPKPGTATVDTQELAVRLRGTRWHLPDVRSHPPSKQWVELGADGKTSAGWHGRRAPWKVLPDGTVAADISYKKSAGTIMRFAPDLQFGTYGEKNEVMHRIPNLTARLTNWVRSEPEVIGTGSTNRN